jgi:heme/copper-type cytochrome/quinol oxidase subunit 4
MDFSQAGLNMIIILTLGIIVLLADLVLFLKKRKTISETVWAINQYTLALAFLAGVIVGHLFTVPGLP